MLKPSSLLHKFTLSAQERVSNMYRRKIEKIDDQIFSLQDYIQYYRLQANKKIELASQKKKQNIQEYVTKQQQLIVAAEEKAKKTIENLQKKRSEWKQKVSGLVSTTQQPILPEDTILKIENLSMHFGGLKAVNDLSFEVKKGEIFGLIGPNGAGKTTVFNCITQFYKPTFGHIYYVDKTQETIVLNKQPVHNVIRKGIVRTFQNVELVWELTILENLLVAAHTLYHSSIFGQIFRTKRMRMEEDILREKSLGILAKLGLSQYAYLYPIGLPYGVLKKIELARTLMCNPKLIILDEPAAGLNDLESAELAETIKSIQKEYNATIFLVEHDMDLVMKICDTICAISFGKKLAIGTASEIQNDPIVQEAYLGGE